MKLRFSWSPRFTCANSVAGLSRCRWASQWRQCHAWCTGIWHLNTNTLFCATLLLSLTSFPLVPLSLMSSLHHTYTHAYHHNCTHWRHCTKLERHRWIQVPYVYLQSDTVATIHFTAHFVRLLFEGGVYFFRKPGDINNGWIGYQWVRR